LFILNQGQVQRSSFGAGSDDFLGISKVARGHKNHYQTAYQWIIKQIMKQNHGLPLFVNVERLIMNCKINGNPKADNFLKKQKER
jgi:hypothetical protein